MPGGLEYVVGRPAPGINGHNGWFVHGRRARAALEHPEQFVAYNKAAAFPRELLHPSIAERVWAALARGDYADAVFLSFRTVEESVRKAGGYADTEIGVDLMRKAHCVGSKVDRSALLNSFKPKADGNAR